MDITGLITSFRFSIRKSEWNGKRKETSSAVANKAVNKISRKQTLSSGVTVTQLTQVGNYSSRPGPLSLTSWVVRLE